MPDFGFSLDIKSEADVSAPLFCFHIIMFLKTCSCMQQEDFASAEASKGLCDHCRSAFDFRLRRTRHWRAVALCNPSHSILIFVRIEHGAMGCGALHLHRLGTLVNMLAFGKKRREITLCRVLRSRASGCLAPPAGTPVLLKKSHEFFAFFAFMRRIFVICCIW